MSNEINICLIGYGQFAAKRADSLSKIEGITIGGIFDTSPTSIKNCKEKYKNIKTHSSLEEASSDSKYQLYIISTPNKLHYQQCSTLLERNANILCEKPISTTPFEAEELEKLFNNSNSRLLYMGSNLSFFPSYKLLCEYIENHSYEEIDSVFIEIGHKISLSKSDWRMNPNLSGGGTLIDNGLHALYFLSKLFEGLSFNRVIDINRDHLVEDQINIELRSKFIDKINLHSTWNENINYSSITLNCEKNKISAKAFDNFITIESLNGSKKVQCTDTTSSIDSESQYIIEKLKDGKKHTNIQISKSILEIICNCYDSCTEI